MDQKWVKSIYTNRYTSVRSLKNPINYIKLDKAFNNYKLAILSLSEVRKTKEKIIITQVGNLFHQVGCKGGQRGIGLLVKSNYTYKLSKTNSWNHRENRYTKN